MMPIGPLMIEHRLIERMIAIAQMEIDHLREGCRPDLSLIDSIVDFIRVYADRTHHGKEEDILFRDLAGKELGADDSRVMRELIEEHQLARAFVRNLVAARQAYAGSGEDALRSILANLTGLVQLYPPHIAKEDKVFFPACIKYFSKEEQDIMLAEMWEFDRRMIHEKYRSVVERLHEELIPRQVCV